jgi:type 1 glutamine amidotransferase
MKTKPPGAFVSLAFCLLALGAAPQEKKKQILFFTKSSGFEHSVIKKKGEEPSHAEKVLRELAKKNNWEVTETKDGGVFTKENLARFDAFFFYTTGVLTTPGTDKNPPMTAEGKAAFLESINSGKGYVGTHAAADTFHPTEPREDRFKAFGDKNDPYLLMVGAEFIRHGKQQKTRMICADPKFPGAAAAGEGFDMTEEWYSFKDYRDDIHVVLVSETKDMLKTGGDSVYNRPPYPATWARQHGKGRVFYTSMGHREDVWTNATFQSMLEGGLKWALKEVEADVTPNVEKVAPGYKVIPPEK